MKAWIVDDPIEAATAAVVFADCPKWKCDNPTMDCERCEFLKEYKKGVDNAVI